MESYQPLHTRSGNQAGSVNSRNTGNAPSTSRSNRSTLKYKSTSDEESRPGSSRRLSRSPSMLQRSAINNNNNVNNKYNKHDELNVSEIGTQGMKNNRCLSRSDELQSTINEYDACFTHFADESSKTQTHTRGKAQERQNELERQEEYVQNEENSPNCYNNNNSSNKKGSSSRYRNDGWRNSRSNSRNRTNAMHDTMQTASRTNFDNPNRDADKQHHAHLTHSTAKFGKEAKPNARVTRSVESILAEYKSKSADSEEYNSVSRDYSKNINNLLSNARTRQALARYNGEPQTASEHIINSVIRDPVILPSVHAHRKAHASKCTNANWTDTLMSTDPWPRLTHASQQWFSATNNTNGLTQTIGPMSDPHSITLPTRLTKSHILAIEDTDAAYGQTLMSETLYFARENEKRKAKQRVAAQNEVVNNRQLSRRGVVQKVELPKRHAILS